MYTSHICDNCPLRIKLDACVEHALWPMSGLIDLYSYNVLHNIVSVKQNFLQQSLARAVMHTKGGLPLPLLLQSSRSYISQAMILPCSSDIMKLNTITLSNSLSPLNTYKSKNSKQTNIPKLVKKILKYKKNLHTITYS